MFKNLLKGNTYAKLKELQEDKKIFEIIEPLKDMDGFKQNNPHHSYDLLEHTLLVVKNIGEDAPEYMKIASLFHDIGKLTTAELKPEDKLSDYDKKYMAENNLTGINTFLGHSKASEEEAKNFLLKSDIDEDTINKALFLIKVHEKNWDSAKTKTVRNFVNDLKENGLELSDYINLRRADVFGQSLYMRDAKLEELEKVEAVYQKILDYEKSIEGTITRSSLDINGRDIVEHEIFGKVPKEYIKDFLNEAINFVNSEEGVNNKEDIINHLKDWFHDECFENEVFLKALGDFNEVKELDIDILEK